MGQELVFEPTDPTTSKVTLNAAISQYVPIGSRATFTFDIVYRWKFVKVLQSRSVLHFYIYELVRKNGWIRSSFEKSPLTGLLRIEIPLLENGEIKQLKELKLEDRFNELEDQLKKSEEERARLQSEISQLTRNLSSVSKVIDAASLLQLDEKWVASSSALNLLEIAANKKLKDFGVQQSGSFRERYESMSELVKEKEGVELPRLLPSSLWEARSKLDHAGHLFKLTDDENRIIIDTVAGIIQKMFKKKGA